MRELWIWMGDRRVGTLDGSDRRSPRVTYADEWLDAAATPLSTSMPLAGRSHAGRQVNAWLWGLLPDNERVLERWASRYRCSATDVVGLLAAVGADVAGAAQFLAPDTTPEDGLGEHRVVPESEVGEMLRALRADATAWHHEMGGRWSLAGAQAKLALAYDESSDTWSVPSGAAPTTHILKPAIPGLDHHDLNEHLCLATASALGLPAARSEIRHFDGETALVVRRYDRAVVGGRVVRVHQEDLCQALGVHPTNKYESDGGPGVEAMAGALQRVSAGNPQAAITRLLHAVGFNWLTLGTDAHAKNYSLLLSGSQVRLAPLYDLASAAMLGEHPRKLRMAQKIGGEHRPTVVAARHWARMGERCGLDGEFLVSQVTDMATRLPEVMSEVVRGERLTEGSSSFAAELHDRITAWTRECRAVL